MPDIIPTKGGKRHAISGDASKECVTATLPHIGYHTAITHYCKAATAQQPIKKSNVCTKKG